MLWMKISPFAFLLLSWIPQWQHWLQSHLQSNASPALANTRWQIHEGYKIWNKKAFTLNAEKSTAFLHRYWHEILTYLEMKTRTLIASLGDKARCFYSLFVSLFDIVLLLTNAKTVYLWCDKRLFMKSTNLSWWMIYFKCCGSTSRTSSKDCPEYGPVLVIDVPLNKLFF